MIDLCFKHHYFIPNNNRLNQILGKHSPCLFLISWIFLRFLFFYFLIFTYHQNYEVRVFTNDYKLISVYCYHEQSLFNKSDRQFMITMGKNGKKVDSLHATLIKFTGQKLLVYQSPIILKTYDFCEYVKFGAISEKNIFYLTA